MERVLLFSSFLLLGVGSLYVFLSTPGVAIQVGREGGREGGVGGKEGEIMFKLIQILTKDTTYTLTKTDKWPHSDSSNPAALRLPPLHPLPRHSE